MAERRLVVPVRATHITNALAAARPDQARFRRDEMEWIRANHAALYVFYTRIFEKSTKLFAIDRGEAFLAGSTLGHFAVRMCVREGYDYEVVKQTFQSNLAADEPYHGEAEGLWSTQQKLDAAFGDPDLTAAFMDIRTGPARAAAALAVGYLCLEEVPAVA